MDPFSILLGAFLVAMISDQSDPEHEESSEKPLPMALPSSLSDARVTYRVIGGNPPFAPYEYGWLLRVNRHTTPVERAWLKSQGFSFSGGKWLLRDEPERLALPLDPETRRAETINEAVRTYGVTDDPASAGFILEDGRWLDFSEGGGMGRAQDHRNVAHLLRDDERAPEASFGEQTQNMNRWMNIAHAIRVSFNPGNPRRGQGSYALVDLPDDPDVIRSISSSSTTKASIARFVRRADAVTIGLPGGRTVEIERPTAADVLEVVEAAAAMPTERELLEPLQRAFEESEDGVHVETDVFELDGRFTKAGPALDGMVFDMMDKSWRDFWGIDEDASDEETEEELQKELADALGVFGLEPNDRIFEWGIVSIRKELRGFGLGTAIAREVERQARIHGAKAILLQAGELPFAEGTHSLTFWQKLGYEEIHGYYSIYDDRFMVKKL